MAALFGAYWDLRLAWGLPIGSFHVANDPLSGFFIATISLICGSAGLYGCQYLSSYQGRKNLGSCWFFYLVLFASMLLVVAARNGMLFLIAWEIMSLASFFLVMFEHDRPGVLDAGWTYLVATHLGTAFLLALFLLLDGGQGQLEFSTFTATGGLAGAAFVSLLQQMADGAAEPSFKMAPNENTGWGDEPTYVQVEVVVDFDLNSPPL